jgi:hypothetical protein
MSFRGRDRSPDNCIKDELCIQGVSVDCIHPARRGGSLCGMAVFSLPRCDDCRGPAVFQAESDGQPVELQLRRIGDDKQVAIADVVARRR